MVFREARYIVCRLRKARELVPHLLRGVEVAPNGVKVVPRLLCFLGLASREAFLNVGEPGVEPALRQVSRMQKLTFVLAATFRPVLFLRSLYRAKSLKCQCPCAG